MMNQLTQQLKGLKLGGILDTLDVRNREAIDRKITYVEFLSLLVQDEIERRDNARLTRRLRKANFNPQKTLESFNFDFNPSIDRKQIFDLASCHYVEKREQVWILGESGTGKTHLAQALSFEACKKEMDALYITVEKMLRDINGGRADGTLGKRLRKYTSPQLLVLDEFALKLFKPQEAEDFYEVIDHRCENGATIITSNRSYEEWPEVFGDSLLASATIDRLTYKATKIEITGPSYRTSRKNKGRRSKSG